MSEGSAQQGAQWRAFVGLGGNLGDRLGTLRAAAAALDRDLPRTRVVAASSVYETRPVGPSSEPFLNAAVELRTELRPEQLLEELLRIEQRHGRVRLRQWDARTLDLDVLLLMRASATEGWVLEETSGARLCVPHPRMVERDFVLVPLGELVEGAVEVRGKTLARWLDGLRDEQRTVLRRLDEELMERPRGGVAEEEQRDRLPRPGDIGAREGG